jgi:hypothetical protein
MAGVGGTPFRVLYADEHLLVVDKSAGLVVHPARGHREGTLSQLLAGVAGGGGAGGDPERPGIVHRLDRDTSGLLVVARSEEAHRLLQRALAERRIEREYLALVEGRPPARSGTIEAPIGRDPRVRTRMATGGHFPPRGPHPLHARARPARVHAPAPAPRHRAHPPDPRAPPGDRPPRRRRPRVRDSRPAGPGAPVPARRPPGVPAPLHRRAAGGAFSSARRPRRRPGAC